MLSANHLLDALSQYRGDMFKGLSVTKMGRHQIVVVGAAEEPAKPFSHVFLNVSWRFLNFSRDTLSADG